MFKFYPVGNPILLAHIWILHKILDRIAPNLECFKKFCLKSKYPNRVEPGNVFPNFKNKELPKNFKNNSFRNYPYYEINYTKEKEMKM